MRIGCQCETPQPAVNDIGWPKDCVECGLTIGPTLTPAGVERMRAAAEVRRTFGSPADVGLIRALRANGSDDEEIAFLFTLMADMNITRGDIALVEMRLDPEQKGDRVNG